MKKQFIPLVLCVVGASIVATGCRSKTVSRAPPAQSAADAKKRAQDKQVQQYILKRRAAARKNSPNHTGH